LILSAPMLKSLKDSSTFHSIFYNHLKFILTILIHSFPTDQESFSLLISKLRETTKSSFEQMKATQFSNFLERFAQRMLAFDERWFRKQTAVHELMLGVLRLITENKVPDSTFSDEICDSLLGGATTIDELMALPAQLSSQDCNIDDTMATLFKKLESCNPSKFFRRILMAYD